MEESKYKFLIVDDMQDHIRGAVTALKVKLPNCEIIEAQSVEEAIDAYQSNRDIDVAIIDLKLPLSAPRGIKFGVGGENVIEEIRKKSDKVEIVVWTLSSEAKLKPMLVKYRAIFFPKSGFGNFGPSILADRIIKLLNK